MKKLLHERLRTLKNLEYGIKRTYNQQGSFLAYELDVRKEDVFAALADEIEKYYIPRPIFEDGVIAQIDDDVDLEGDIGHIVGMNIEGDHVVVIVSDNEHYVTHFLNMKEEGVLKYPIFKICDVDGVPINGGDTVWNIENGEKLEVLSVSNDRLELAFYVDGIGNISTSWISPDKVTHKEPILDIDGELIKVEDTVYTLTSDIKMKVLSFDVNSRLEPIVKTDAGSFKPDELTHKEPVLDVNGIPIKNDDTVWHIKKGWKGVVVSVYGEVGNTVGVDWGNGEQTCAGFDLTHKEPDSIQKVIDYLNECGNSDPSGLYYVAADRLKAILERGA